MRSFVVVLVVACLVGVASGHSALHLRRMREAMNSLQASRVGEGLPKIEDVIKAAVAINKPLLKDAGLKDSDVSALIKACMEGSGKPCQDMTAKAMKEYYKAKYGVMFWSGGASFIGKQLAGNCAVALGEYITLESTVGGYIFDRILNIKEYKEMKFPGSAKKCQEINGGNIDGIWGMLSNDLAQQTDSSKPVFSFQRISQLRSYFWKKDGEVDNMVKNLPKTGGELVIIPADPAECKEEMAFTYKSFNPQWKDPEKDADAENKIYCDAKKFITDVWKFCDKKKAGGNWANLKVYVYKGSVKSAVTTTLYKARSDINRHHGEIPNIVLTEPTLALEKQKFYDPAKISDCKADAAKFKEKKNWEEITCK